MSTTGKALMAVGVFVGVTSTLFRLLGPCLHSTSMVALSRPSFDTGCVLIGSGQLFRPELKYKLPEAACIADTCT